jgi:hypothetical protein
MMFDALISTFRIFDGRHPASTDDSASLAGIKPLSVEGRDMEKSSSGPSPLHLTGKSGAAAKAHVLTKEQEGRTGVTKQDFGCLGATHEPGSGKSALCACTLFLLLCENINSCGRAGLAKEAPAAAAADTCPCVGCDRPGGIGRASQIAESRAEGSPRHKRIIRNEPPAWPRWSPNCMSSLSGASCLADAVCLLRGPTGRHRTHFCHRSGERLTPPTAPRSPAAPGCRLRHRRAG